MAEKKEKRYVSDNAQLMAEWVWDRNNELGHIPQRLTCGSDKTAWWKCSKGHEWKAKIYSRNYGSGCPKCATEQNTSFPEYAILFYLQKHNLYAIHSFKELGYELDVYIPSHKIAIEYDGYYWHKNKIREDLEKNYRCRNDGIKLYRIREGLLSLNDSSTDFTIHKSQRDFPKILKLILSEIIGAAVDIDISRDVIAIENLREHEQKENSLAFTNRRVAEEWNHEKNGILVPEFFLANSQKKVWWKCHKGHEWQATIANRNQGSGCPYCFGQKVLLGYNDLQTLNPVIAQEWNREKNGGLMPKEFTASSHKKVWWTCSAGHEWQATIKNRNYGHGCPYCAVLNNHKGHSQLQSANPQLVKEWNYEKNRGTTPADVMPNSTIKVWWKCRNGHEWQARIDHRNKGSGCPYCAGQKVLAGTNDLQTVNPVLAKEWNYEKNHELTPVDVMPNSHRNVHWVCNKGHEYTMSIKDRNRGRICPECAKEKRKKKPR